MWLGEMKLEPQTAEEINDCATPDGMRRRLFKYERSNALVKAISDASRYRGLSGEDKMTWLAFEALRRVEQLEELILKDAMNSPLHTFILKEERK